MREVTKMEGEAGEGVQVRKWEELNVAKEGKRIR